MDFYKLIQSLDELVYEVLSWMLFYPITLWRVIRHPIASMLSAERELKEDDEHSFDDMLGPPLFLFLTLLLIHFVEMAVTPEQASELIKSDRGIAHFIKDDTNLIIFRVLVFGLLPLTAARRLLRIRGQQLDKSVLRPAFYAQCYACAIYAILFNASAFFLSTKWQYHTLIGIGLVVAAIAWFVAVEGKWFAEKQGQSLTRGVGNALVVFLEWLAIVTVVYLFVR